MLTRQQVEEILDHLCQVRSEVDDAECKSSAADSVKDAICALSNRRDRNGGVVFVGVDADFQITGLPSVEAAQQLVVDWASDLYNVPLRVSPEILERAGQPILAVIVPPCPAGHRPCHYKAQSPYNGAWIRVGNSTRQMTRDEVRREIATDEISRGTVPPFDAMPYPQANMDDLDNTRIDAYIKRVKEIRPASRIGDQSRLQVLCSINAAAEHEGAWHPTPAGLLFFCSYPQRYLPQSSVEFLHLWGSDLTTSGPDGSRWRLNKELTGTLPEIIDALENLLIERVEKRGFIDSFRRRDEPEYPRFALREAIINAVAHRDYTMRGSRIQVRLFSDRLEVHSPGGLPPPVTVDNIEDEEVARNEAIVIPLQDFNYMERRGYGFNGMVATMREAGLAPPLLRDNGASFDLCLKSHVLMSPETVVWLKQFDGLDLSQREKLALAYLRANEGFKLRLYNRDYVRLNNCTSVEATQDLRHMVEQGALEMHSTRGGAYYTLPEQIPQIPINLFDAPVTEEESILTLAQRAGSVTVTTCSDQLRIPKWRVSKILQRLSQPGGVLQPHGTRRWRYYTPV